MKQESQKNIDATNETTNNPSEDINSGAVSFQPKAFIKAFFKHRSLIAVSVIVCTLFSIISYRLAPKTYKVQSTLSIQTQYFQIPLVRDFIPETFDGLELKSQREALVRRALNHDYLMQLGLKYKLFGSKEEREITSYDLDVLSKRFEVIPLGASGFQVSFMGKDPKISYEIMNEFLHHLRITLSSERRSTLMRVHNAIQGQLEALSFGHQATNNIDNRPTSTSSDLARQEIDRITTEIQTLTRDYSDRHPRIAELTRRRDQLAKWLKQGQKSLVSSDTDSEDAANTKLPITGTTDISGYSYGNDKTGSSPLPSLLKSRTFSGTKVDPSSRDLFQDLLKKYHYLQVVIYLDQKGQDSFLSVLQEPFLPKSPLWPKLPLFLFWGLALGFLVGSILAFTKEVLAEQGKDLTYLLSIIRQTMQQARQGITNRGHDKGHRRAS